jgi:hypothetical protein
MLYPRDTSKQTEAHSLPVSPTSNLLPRKRREALGIFEAGTNPSVNMLVYPTHHRCRPCHVGNRLRRRRRVPVFGGPPPPQEHLGCCRQHAPAPRYRRPTDARLPRAQRAPAAPGFPQPNTFRQQQTSAQGRRLPLHRTAPPIQRHLPSASGSHLLRRKLAAPQPPPLPTPDQCPAGSRPQRPAPST